LQHVAAILLAAGGSSRMGSPKQLLTYQGQTLLRRAAETAIAAKCDPVVVVIGAEAERMRQELVGLSVHIAVNSGWERGIGSSIRVGVQSVLDCSPAVSSTFILLCDQPFVTAATLQRLRDAQLREKRPVCVSTYHNTIGPPVLARQDTFPQLLTLPDSVGAKALWLGDPNAVSKVDCEEAAIDLDTPEDYQRIIVARE
jgi:molybdenum cofactor cytidylyltransferase